MRLRTVVAAAGRVTPEPFFFRLTGVVYRRSFGIPVAENCGADSDAVDPQNFRDILGHLSMILVLGFWASGMIFGFCSGATEWRNEHWGARRITFAARSCHNSGEIFYAAVYGDKNFFFCVPTTPSALAAWR